MPKRIRIRRKKVKTTNHGICPFPLDSDDPEHPSECVTINKSLPSETECIACQGNNLTAEALRMQKEEE